jgi:hypothetical protein
MDAILNGDGTMHEIVGESGTQTGEGCLRDIAVVAVAVAMLAAGVGGLVWLLS